MILFCVEWDVKPYTSIASEKNQYHSLLWQFAACEAKNRNCCYILANFSYIPASILKLLNLQKANEKMFLTICWPNGNLIKFFYTNRIQFFCWWRNGKSHTNKHQHPPPKKKPPLPLGVCGPHQIHPSLDWPHSLPHTASRSNQPFFHNSSTRQTDRLTDRLDRQQACSNTCLR